MYRIVRLFLVLLLLVGTLTTASPALATTPRSDAEEDSPSLISRALERILGPVLTLLDASEGGLKSDPDGFHRSGGEQDDTNGAEQDSGPESDPNG